MSAVNSIENQQNFETKLISSLDEIIAKLRPKNHQTTKDKPNTSTNQDLSENLNKIISTFKNLQFQQFSVSKFPKLPIEIQTIRDELADKLNNNLSQTGDDYFPKEQVNSPLRGPIDMGTKVYYGQSNNEHKPHGWGILYYHQDPKRKRKYYEGSFHNGMICGYGQLIYENGGYELADFNKEGKMHMGFESKNPAKQITHNGKTYTGIFQKGYINNNRLHGFCSSSSLEDNSIIEEGNYRNGDLQK